jgi:hypothetical protein
MHMRWNDPRNTRYELASPGLNRGHGVTDSERYLSNLATRSFLNLWCYPNVFIDKRVRGKGDGKELCDLLVVCGDHVLVFSDKSVAWPEGELSLAWARWYRRAIEHSVNQIRGAERWISQFPDRLFTDRGCTSKLPISLPPRERRRVHGIVVANGAVAACRAHFSGGSGSMMLASRIVGDQHSSENAQPFAIGDVDPAGSFVHVFDEVSLSVVMRELDTINDFTAYLAKKERLVRSGKLISAAGEEELVAEYMIRMNSEGEHDFTKPDGSALGVHDFVSYGSGLYSQVVSNHQFIAKKKADEISYVWDRLITIFTDSILQGTSRSHVDGMPDGHFDVMPAMAKQEFALREMALLSRFDRRSYGQSLLDVLEQGQKQDRFMRAIISGPDHPRADVGFFFLTVKVPQFELKDGYEQYRAVRMSILETYGYTLLRNNPQLKRVIGIATEPKSEDGKATGSSEDLMYLEPPRQWTEELLKDLSERKVLFGIDRPGNTHRRAVHNDEFPETVATGSHRDGLNRRQRRAMKAKLRRDAPK